ncbi:MAG: tetratricopeptide repeat protein [Xanthomonadaceae bacterium]|nr:tetratricopeptide repeat protein [Xanthomonadaceae bacterium]
MPRYLIIALLLVHSSGYARAVTPYLSQELSSVETGNEGKIRELRNEEINQIRIALGRRAPKNRMADLYFRLAELYLEAYRADFLREGRVHDQRLKAGIKSSALDRTTSMVSLRYGVKSCQELVKLKIPFERMDHVYFFLGYNNKELGNAKESQKYFHALVEKYPSSPFVYEGLKELGDFAFDSAKYREAHPYYERALKLPVRGETEARVKYRLAWTYYRLKQFSRAIEEMKAAISMAGSSGDRFISLKEEALRDMALFLTETGNVGEAITYFQSVLNDRNYYPKVLERLGREYERNAKPDKAIQVYEAILQTHPESEAAISIVNKLMDVDTSRGRFDRAIVRLKLLKLPDSIPSDSELAYANLKAFVRKTATENHEIYRKKSKKEYLQVAAGFYSNYIDFFLKRSDPRGELNEIKMYLADAKRDLGQSAASAELYKQIIQSKDSKYSKQAADLWVGSLTEVLKTQKHSSGELTAVELDFISAVDFLNDNSPETETAKEASLRVAQLYAAYPKYQAQCINRIERIIDQFPASKQAVTVAKLWLQIRADKKDTAGVSDLMAKFKKNEALMKFDHDNKGILISAIAQYSELLRVSGIEAIEKTSDFVKAASEYEKFANETKDPKQVEKALNNALVYYEKNSNWDSVMRMASRLKNTAAIKRAALQYFIAGQESKSALAFAQAGEHLAAARVAEGAGDYKLALAQTEIWFKANPNSDQRGKNLLNFAKLAIKAGEPAQAETAFQNCADTKKSSSVQECILEWTRLAKKQKKTATLEKIASKYHSSESSLEIFKSKWSGTQFPPISLPDAKLKQGVQDRMRVIEKQAGDAKRLIESGGPVSISALEFLSSQILMFADQIDHADLSKATTPAAKENYKKSLAKVTAPIRQKAKGFSKRAFEKAQELNIYTPEILNLAQDWASDRQNLWARVQGSRPQFRVLGIPVDGSESETNEALVAVRVKLAAQPQAAQSWIDYGNILWRQKKLELAKVAFFQALDIQPKNTAALNNLSVMELSKENVDDVFKIQQADYGFRRAMDTGDGAWIPKWNLAQILLYYRLFKSAKPLIEAVRKSQMTEEIESAYAVALAGTGNGREASQTIKNAEKLDGDTAGSKYHRAILKAALATGEDCVDELDRISGPEYVSLEQKSVVLLRSFCDVH